MKLEDRPRCPHCGYADRKSFDLEIALTRLRAGERLYAVAASMGISTAVLSHHTSGLVNVQQGRNRIVVDLDRVASLRELGMNSTAIAKRLGISRATLETRMREAKETTRNKHD